MKYKAAVVQFSSGEDIQENLARIETCIGRAAGNQAIWLFFQNMRNILVRITDSMPRMCRGR